MISIFLSILILIMPITEGEGSHNLICMTVIWHLRQYDFVGDKFLCNILNSYLIFHDVSWIFKGLHGVNSCVGQREGLLYVFSL